jgi:hypothetical protein
MIELTVHPHPDEDSYFQVSWTDGEPVILAIFDVYLDLIPFMVARQLLQRGYRDDVERLLVVRLTGADYELMRAPLGQVAAKPLVNTTPVTRPTHSIYRRRGTAPND